MISEQEAVQFLKKAEKTSLSPETKAVFRGELVVFMEAKPLPKSVKEPWISHILSIFTVQRFVSSGMVATLVILLAGGSVSFAAEKALPGETLYSVKRNINEPVRGAIALTPQAKADWEVERTRRRVTEAEELSQRGELSDTYRKDIEDQTSQSAERVNALVKNLDSRDDTEKARQVETSFHEALRGGKKIHAEASERKIIIRDGERNESEKESATRQDKSEKQDISKKDKSEKQDVGERGE